MITQHKIKMNLTKHDDVNPVWVTRGDLYSRNLEISFFSDEDEWSIPEDVSIIIRYIKPDGKGGAYDTLPNGDPAWSASGNVLILELAPQVLTAAGLVILDVTLISQQRQITSFSIPITVENTVNDLIEASDVYRNVTGFLPSPASAEPGQYLRVRSVDDSGRVLEVEAAGGSAENALLYTEQSLTEEQQAQARANIGVLAPGEVAVDANSWVEIPITWTGKNQYAGIDSINNFEACDYADSDYDWVKLDVSAGDTYEISTRHQWDCVGYAVTGANDNQVIQTDGYSDSEITEFTQEFTVAIGGAYLYVNKMGFQYLRKKTVSGTTVVTSSSRKLAGKKIVYDGDSISESRDDNGGGYAKIIADLTGGVYVNQAVGGAGLRSGIAGAHCVADNLVNLPIDGDIYCFQGGINDYWRDAVLGTYTQDDFTGEVDATTVCGALETIFRYALNTFAGKPVCFVITHKIQNTAYRKNGAGNTFKEYRDAMAGICQKYSIPFYDAFSESGLNGWNEIQSSLYLTGNNQGNPDGCHPNAEGCKRYYVPQLLALFEKMMPVA